MNGERLTVATWIGVAGGVAAVVGTVLPWLDFPHAPGTIVSGFFLSPNIMLLMVVATSAAAWLWTGADARKAIAVLAPVSFALVTMTITVWMRKEEAFFAGTTTGGDTGIGIGLVLTLIGGCAGLLASGIVVYGLTHPAVDDVERPGVFDLGEVSDHHDPDA